MEAAFFDLDKTVIAKASMVAFSGPLHRAGLLSRRCCSAPSGASSSTSSSAPTSAKLAKLRDSVLRAHPGLGPAEISAIVRETLDEVIEPIVYDEALDLIRAPPGRGAQGLHRLGVTRGDRGAAGAVPRGRRGLATRAELDDDGRYTGRTEVYCYGPARPS